MPGGNPGSEERTSGKAGGTGGAGASVEQVANRLDSARARLRAGATSRPALVLGRFLCAVAVAGVLLSPLAVSRAVARTQVHELVGITPTTFSLTTAGRSEVRLGIAGTLFLPLARGPLGVVATVDGPADPEVGGADLASYVTPRMLEIYTGLFHDPKPAIEGYLTLLQRELRQQLLLSWLLYAGTGGTALFALSLIVRPGRLQVQDLPRARVLAAGAVVLATSTTLAVVGLRPHEPGTEDAGFFDLPALDGTVVAGATTDSPVLQLALGGAVPKVQSLVERQERRKDDYDATASRSLEDQADAVAGPREGELAVLMQSDMHCNATMIELQKQVADRLRSTYGEGVPALMAITGDLTTNGTAAEGGCIAKEAAIAGEAPVAAVTGNHESDVSATQMKDSGMTVLDGSTVEVGGVKVLGDGDPNRSELFGATRLRGDESEDQLGARLFDEAGNDRPDLVLVHEAYAAQAFVGVDGMTAFLDGRGSPTRPAEDGVRDLPASAVFYGHWHRSTEPRVVWNSDGTWTLVMELDTSGGAIADPTLGNFSTPWSRPQQEASFPVVFLDEASRLVTGYQIYSFATDGTVTVAPRVDVGAQPSIDVPAESARSSR